MPVLGQAQEIPNVDIDLLWERSILNNMVDNKPFKYTDKYESRSNPVIGVYYGYPGLLNGTFGFDFQRLGFRINIGLNTSV